MLPKVLKNWSLYIDGRGYAGLAKKIKLPKLETEGEDYRAAGMLGTVKIELGIKGLELGFTLAEFSAAVLRSWGVQDISGINARFLGAAVAADGAGTDAIEISVRGRWESLDMGDVEGKKLSELDVTMPLTYYRYSLNGEVLIEIDMISGKMVVDGKDMTADQLNAIGQTA